MRERRLRVPPRRAVAVRVRARAALGDRRQRRRHVQRRRGGAGDRRQARRLLVVGVGLRRRARVTPMTEEHPFNNRTIYGATKIAGEQFFRAFNEQHGLDYVGLRYMNIYGPRMDYKGTYVSVIMKVLDRIEAGEPPVIFGDGSQAYDFVHVADVARANILALKSDATDEFFNVGMGVRDDDQRARRAAARSSPAPTSSPSTGRRSRSFVTHRVGSTEKAEQLLGFRASDPARGGPRVGRSRGARRDQRVAAGVGEDPDRAAAVRAGGAARGPAAARERLGRPGAVRRGVRAAASASYTGAPHAVATTSCTTRAAPDRRGARRRAGRRGDRPRVHVGLDRERRRVHGRDAGVLRRRPRRRTTSTSRSSSRSSPSAPSAIIAVHLFGLSRGHRRRSSSSRGGTGSGSSRTRPARSARWYRGRHVGTLRRRRRFSFHPRKSITTGEGGMVTTTDDGDRRRSRARCATTAPQRADAGRRRGRTRSCSPTSRASASTTG